MSGQLSAQEQVPEGHRYELLATKYKVVGEGIPRDPGERRKETRVCYGYQNHTRLIAAVIGGAKDLAPPY